MNERWDRLLVGLADAGCTREEIQGARRLLETDRSAELTRYLRRCRANRMDEMHESQKKVDRMDYLIRQAEKTIRKGRKDGKES